MQRRDRSYVQSLGKPLLRKVKESRVLLVGAGGIGCEVLKNLVCCGFGSFTVGESEQVKEKAVENKEALNGVGTAAAPIIQTQPKPRHGIVVIDLDTIDLSNLNRQFLFRKHHIKKSKAQVAKETASRFNPYVNIEAHHASIFDAKYNVDFYESFDVVFNALDNLAARRHVNRMCLAANVPLIESGTTGFNGQVQAIKKGSTECYDCNPKPVQKSFPICTIRSTPSQPIHCIVWAKSYLFPELFGTSEDDSTDMAVTAEDNAEEVAKLKEEADALKKIRSMMGKDEFAQEVFNKVFHDDIERLRSLTEMWQSRKPPESLQFNRSSLDARILKQGQTLALQDQRPWSLLENISVFCSSLDALSHRALDGEKIIEFDKDDKDTLDFVASAANLRSYIFGIPLNSEWDIKQMAGNIIPAIATSNALTASLCVLEAFKIMRSQNIHAHDQHPNSHGPVTVNGKEEPLLGGSKMVFLTSKNTERMITTQTLQPPNPECPVCSPLYARLVLPHTSGKTLQDLVDLLKERIGYEDLSITTDAGIIYDPDLDDNLPKPLKELGIDGQGNGFITVMDESEGPKIELVLSAKLLSESIGRGAEVRALQLLPERIELPLKPTRVIVNGELGEEVELAPATATPVASNKRKRGADDNLESESASAKKTKSAKADDEGDVFVIEDDGAIILDD